MRIRRIQEKAFEYFRPTDLFGKEIYFPWEPEYKNQEQKQVSKENKNGQ